MTRGEALLAWYVRARRDLPWRHTTDPYRILVSEVMLQQTPVARVLPAYTAFLERFPDARSLAHASLSDVLAAWQGLGYPNRARRLRQAMQIVTENGWPAGSSRLQDLPGIGPYTAAAVASFAFGEQIAVVDTNVRRVVSRWQGRMIPERDLSDAAQDEITGPAGTWNQAMMELGAVICRPVPQCELCPVSKECTDPSVYLPPPRQPRYKGSMRQVRGDILRALQAQPTIPLTELAVRVGHDAERVEAALGGLMADGFVTTTDRLVTIAG